ncbi:MAG TPA: hypothetical protein VF183_12905 [Acidimicrobiales bacterium]
MKRLFVAAAAAVLLLAACGDDDVEGLSRDEVPELSAEEQALADRVSASMLDDPDTQVTPEEADCVGARVVKALGVERTDSISWEEDGLTFEPDDADHVARSLHACVDTRSLLAEGFSQGAAITADQGACLARDLSDDDVVRVISLSLSAQEGTEDDYEPLADAFLECLDIGELIVSGVAFTISDASARCLADALPHDLLKRVFIAGMMGEDPGDAHSEFVREVMRATPDCLTDEELAELGE